ncbi:MAG: hypothetical protein A2X61_08075 [Ignavibacteria bacterium GWB2_35_12]|nr:MAG: hypothetical protein A2X61_08075 [Ignavibacteria bacterium GWB2_35_12]OGU92489.1 MAG: hypothetical protein A2220_11755 [Ignavibacteria bacterium RIFOXYA2_FULL_35_10]OGV20186.1 MAG: hypothetical protein A2475_15180 [Ignavibacteria bacterium RIFOXYC2_FULL_35_21]
MFNIEEMLDKIEGNTDKIADILACEGRLDIEQIKELSNLYDKRQEMLDGLKEWYKTEEAIEYFKKKENTFEKRITAITDKDKKQLDNIEKRANDLKSKLKEMRKQKSVLIYSKEI